MSSTFPIVLVQKEIAAFDQHAHTAADVVAQGADLGEAPQDLHSLVYAQKNAVSRGKVVGRDVSSDAAQVCFCPAGDEEFSHADAWHL
jgi:hypothetical protein